MKGVERTNAVVVRRSRAGVGQNMGVPPRWDPYAMEVDHRRNCYACRGFGHMAHNCRNRGQRGRIEEIMNITNNLKENENLELLN